MSRFKVLTSAAIAAAVGFGSVAVSADEVADFYKGKRLKMIVGSGAGGGYSTENSALNHIDATLVKLREHPNNRYAREAIPKLEQKKFKLLHAAEKEEEKRKHEIKKSRQNAPKVIEVPKNGMMLTKRWNRKTGEFDVIGERKILTPEEEAYQKQTGRNKADREAWVQDNITTAMMKVETGLVRRDKVLNTIDNAIKISNGWTTGWIGMVARFIPGTDARTLKNLLTEVKAVVGFEFLMQMRETNPNSAAFGQIPNLEIEFLQAAMGKLDQKMGAPQLISQLQKVALNIEYFYKARENEFKDTFGKMVGKDFLTNLKNRDMENPFEKFDIDYPGGDNNTGGGSNPGGDPQGNGWITLPSGIKYREVIK